MAAPNMNGRLHLADAHQNSPASLEKDYIFRLQYVPLKTSNEKNYIICKGGGVIKEELVYTPKS